MTLEEIIGRIKLLKRLKSDGQVATALGIRRNTLSEQKRRNKIPWKELLTFCEREDVSIDFLFGRQKIPENLSEEPGPYGYHDEITTRILDLLRDLPDERKRDVLRYIEKEKFFEDLIKRKEASQ